MRVCQDSDIGGGGIWIGGLYKGFGWPRMHGSHAHEGRTFSMLFPVPQSYEHVTDFKVAAFISWLQIQ